MFGLSIVKENELLEIKETLNIYQRQLEDIGWINLSTDGDNDSVIAGGFQKMLKRSRTYYYNNPLAGHWVNLTTYFVFGEGLEKPKAKDPKVQEIIDTFWSDPDNRLALTSFEAQYALSNKIQYEGNLFFSLFADEEGDVRVRVINTTSVVDVIKDNDDEMRTVAYKVKVAKKKFNYASDSYDFFGSKFVYYLDKSVINENEIGIPREKIQDARIYHCKINADINDKQGIPDLYRGLDWMQAHKNMAGDVATLVKALSRFAWKKKIKGNQSQVNRIKGATNAKSDRSNAAPASGSTQIENESLTLQSMDVKTGGVDIGIKGLKQMLLMVCAGSGIFEHYYGDPSTGNLATAKSMELPMVKKFQARQKLWQGIIHELIMECVKEKIKVGTFPGSIETDHKTGREYVDTDVDLTVDIDFPPILEKDLKELSDSLDSALRNKLISQDLASRIYLVAANQNNIDEEVKAAAAEPDKVEPQPQKVEVQPIKESIDAPEKEVPVKTDRFKSKYNYMTARTNSYAKALRQNFRKFQKSVDIGTVVSGEDGKFVGNVNGLNKALDVFEKSMKGSARIYFPEAIKIGRDFTQAYLKDLNISVEESLFERAKVKDSLLDAHIANNDKFITTSLVPDMRNKINAVVKEPYATKEEFYAAVNTSVATFEPRVDLYVGAFWTAEEAAVKEAGKGADIMANFAGPSDKQTCAGCEAAISGNPWPLDEAPVPGEQDCLGNCRHALQIITAGEA